MPSVNEALLAESGKVIAIVSVVSNWGILLGILAWHRVWAYPFNKKKVAFFRVMGTSATMIPFSVASILFLFNCHLKSMHMYMGGCYALTIGHVITITQWRVAVAAFGGKPVSPLGKILPSATLTIYIILVVTFVPVEQTRCISILGGLLLAAIILTIYMTTNKAIQAHGPTANCSRVRLAWSCFFFSLFVAISFSVTQKVIFIPWGVD